jgi:hypothetical protein
MIINLPLHLRVHNLRLIYFGFPLMLEADNLECVRGERRLFAGLGFKLEAGNCSICKARTAPARPACCA